MSFRDKAQELINRGRDAIQRFLGGAGGDSYPNGEESNLWGNQPEAPAQQPPAPEQQPYPPQGGYQEPQQEAYYPPQQEAFYPPQQEAYYPPQQEAYYPPQQAAYQQPQYQQPEYAPQEAQQPQQGFFGSREKRAKQQPKDNIVPMPNVVMGADGAGYFMTQRVMQVTGSEDCHAAIDFMRGEEMLVLNFEAIAAEAEVQHYVDMLSGAAYTLRYVMTKVSSVKRVYVLSPQTVQVMMDMPTQRINNLNARANEGMMGRQPRRRVEPMEEEEQPAAVGYGGYQGGYENEPRQAVGGFGASFGAYGR